LSQPPDQPQFACDFLVYRSDEFEKRLAMGDPFLEMIVSEGKVLYG